MGRAKVPGTTEETFHPLPDQGHLHAACERIERESVSLQGIVAIEDEIQGGFRTVDE